MADVLFQTYQAIGNREDLIDVITNISPSETPMLSRFGKASASNTYHEWQTDVLKAASATGYVEGVDTDAVSATPSVRTGNYTQISKRVFRVSKTQQAVVSAGRSNEFNYQKMLALKELARDIETSIHDNTGNSGASGTGRTLKGVRSFISTNVETGTDTGTEALTATMLNDLLQSIWDDGGRPNAIYVAGWQKRKISGFTTPNTRFIDSKDKSFVQSISVYESDFGVQQVILDRYATTTELLALQDDLWKIAFLRSPYSESLPDGGGGPKGVVEAEYTLESRNEAGSGKITGLTTS